MLVFVQKCPQDGWKLKEVTIVKVTYGIKKLQIRIDLEPIFEPPTRVELVTYALRERRSANWATVAYYFLVVTALAVQRATEVAVTLTAAEIIRDYN